MMKILLLLLAITTLSLLPQVSCKRLRCYFCKNNCGKEGAKVTTKVCPKNFGCATNEEIHNGKVFARFYACLGKEVAECMDMPHEIDDVMTNVSLCFNVCETNFCNNVIPIDDDVPMAFRTTMPAVNSTQTTMIRNGSTPTTAAYVATTGPTMQLEMNTTATPSGGRKCTFQLWLVFLSLCAFLMAK